MERAVGFLPEEHVTLLSIQYRMHTDIMNWSNKLLYESRLSAHESVAHHTLSTMVEPEKSKHADLAPVIYVDTTGCSECCEVTAPNDLSIGNPGEATIVAAHVEFLVKDCNIAAKDVGVISPYNHQVELIRELIGKFLSPKQLKALEVRSVDGFQGREKEAIVLSLVRSNEEGVIGFLGEVRRLNVAVTRARRQIFVIGNSETLKRGKHLENLVDYLYEVGEVKSGAEYFAKPTTMATDQQCNQVEKVTENEPNESKKSEKVETEEDPKPKVDESEETKIKPSEKVTKEPNEEEPQKSNRALKKELKQQMMEEKRKMKSQAASASAIRTKGTSSDPVRQPAPTEDENELVVKPIPKIPLQSAGTSKDRGRNAADKAAQLALEKVTDPNDIDALCAAVQQMDSKCAYHQDSSDPCPKSVNVLFHFCHHCKRKFCLSHAQPEIHGCGAEAKLFERLVSLILFCLRPFVDLLLSFFR